MERKRLTVPAELPIAERADELIGLIRDHQVVIVAGETGSGKSTQLPKLCLAAGRGVDGLIGHTQPRRVAARTIAERVAEELCTPLGEAVGFAVRFTDKVSEATLIKVMTDGIVLAEIQRDRDLRRYDTLIIDEAHERSLNIDVILGYVKQLIVRRPDLHVIVTSATIDTERFAAHFDGAPIVEVSGRTYPVEVRYRPFGVDPGDERDQVTAICDAVTELAEETTGDVLVFLSGEREIHDTADALRKLELRHTEVLPLYARLSWAEQHRIFQPHTGRRIVLATNVAETSITVPGVRAVIDTGLARISRYSARLKVQRLPIEPISQASARQRSGRCGRVAAGIAIRLYAEDEFNDRPEYTEPEILRTNLASVILQMTAIGLGDIDAFPFVEPPDRRAIRDGVALLRELGAITETDDGERQLTPIGRRLARLPIDPRLGRMILEADALGVVRDVVIIAAALSIQDPRERPLEHREAADALHRRFAGDGSDFVAFVQLWNHLRAQQRELSSNQFRRLCRSEFLNYMRVREWQDLFSQLRQVCADLGIKVSGDESVTHADHVHQAILSGLLSHVGMKDPAGREYRGAHGSRFVIGQGSALGKSQPQWVMAAELVETSRLFARVVAPIKPEWAERLGAHLVATSYGDPLWDEQGARAVALMRVSLFGLPLVAGRRVGYDRVDRTAARTMFITEALVAGEWSTTHRFQRENADALSHLDELVQRYRRDDLIDADSVVAFYDQRIGPDVVSGRHFDAWYRRARAADRDVLRLDPATLVQRREGEAAPDEFPDEWRTASVVLPITYRFDPGSPIDGVTVHVPLTALNLLDNAGFDWHIGPYRAELIAALIRTLPKEFRRPLTPMASAVAHAVSVLGPPASPTDESIIAALADALSSFSGSAIPAGAFDADKLPGHLQVTFAVTDEQGRVVAVAKDPAALGRQFADEARAAVAAASPLTERSGLTTWDFGQLPEVVEIRRDGHTVRGFPTLLDTGSAVSLRIVTSPSLQSRAMVGGLRRLLLIAASPSRKQLASSLANDTRLALARQRRVELDTLIDDAIAAALDAITARMPRPVRDSDAFSELVALARDEAFDVAATALGHGAQALVRATAVDNLLAKLVAPAVQPSARDAYVQLERLLRPGFLARGGVERADDLPRYVAAIERRLTKVAENVSRDQARMAEVHGFERRAAALADRYDGEVVPPEVANLAWLLEEFRVHTFAQSLGARSGVSATKVTKELSRLGG